MRRFTPFLFCSFLSAGFLTPEARGENLSMDHPAASQVQEYLTAVVSQDWETAGSMLSEESLRKKLAETVEIIKMAPTMTEEAAMLAKLGVMDLSELEKMSPIDFYAAERSAVHERLNIAPEVVERKKETLKINIIGLSGEEDRDIVHAVVRTSQETLTDRIEELFLISLRQKDEGGENWLIVPDMMRPLTEKLEAQAAASGE